MRTTTAGKVMVYQPKVHRTCGEPGICQGLQPRCRLCDGHAEDETDTDWKAEESDSWDTIAYYSAVVLAAALSMAGVLGFGGYAYIRWIA